jgi:hypothetical protein
MMNQPPSGSQQLGFHFMPSAGMELDFRGFGGESKMFGQFYFGGSAGPDIINQFANPIELGLCTASILVSTNIPEYQDL